MATNKNFEVKNGLSVGGTERISSAGAFAGSLASGVTATTQSAADSSTKIATTAYTDAAITALIGGAPSALNDLNELAAAIADDANYSTTLTTALATKAPLASPALTGTVTAASHVQIAGNLDVVGQIGAYNNPGSSWGKMILRANDLEYKNSGGTIKVSIDAAGDVNMTGNVDVTGKVMAGNVLATHGHANADDFIVGNISGSATGLTIVNADGGTGNIHFSDGTSSGNANIQGQLVYAHNDNSMRFYTAVSEKMRLKSTGHLTLNDANHSFSGVNNSLLASSNGYMYAMGGTSGLYLADNSALSNAIGIRDANYIDFTTGGVSTHKFDTAGIHFQRADGQSITAKESIVMTVDVDNNTASRVFQVNHGNGKTLLNLYDDYRTDVGTLQFSSTRSAGAGATSSFSASAGDWVDIAAVPYGRNIATVKLFWDGLSAPGSAHHGNMEFDIQSHYGTSYYYGWDSSINLKNSSAHNSFYIQEARIITPNGSGATGYFQVKFGVAVSTGLFRSYVTHRDEQCSIDPVNPAVNNSRSGTTIAEMVLDNRPSLATSRDLNVTGMVRAQGHPAFRAAGNNSWNALTGNAIAPFNVAVVNTGGHYSASNYTFTAPVAGNYYFAWHTYNDSGYSNAIVPRLNGTAMPGGGGDSIVAFSASGLGGNLTISASIVLALAKNDYVDLACRTNHSSRIYMPHSQFSGYLIA